MARGRSAGNGRGPEGRRALPVQLLDRAPVYPNQRHESWRIVERLGRTGDLHRLLNDFAAPDLPGIVLRDAFDRHGWLGIQSCMFHATGSHPQSSVPGMTYRQALLESLLFAHYGFLVKRCIEGGHWYVTGDPRRLECPDHATRGQQKRFRAKHRRAFGKIR